MAPFLLRNPDSYARDRWQIKIYDGEPDYETPQVTVIQKGGKGSVKAWRVSLRTFAIIDATPPRGDLPKAFLEHIKENAQRLRNAWDERYPRNKVFSTDLNLREAKKSKSKKRTKRKGK